ncbi:MAG: PQQ-dependent sugar dehydrogenase [bacterium]|nr:PQQ-dependent sugar dehydrogenase [bacterium]
MIRKLVKQYAWVCGAAVGIMVMSMTAAAQTDTVITREGAPDAASVQMVEVANGFDRPLLVTHAGDGSNRLFVVEQGGVVWVVRDGQRLETPFLNVSSLISPEATTASGYTERGLLGLAFDPAYADNGRFFVNYTDIQGNTVLARYQVTADNPNQADPNSAVILLTQAQPFANHNGGHLAFGPDGYLYVGLGDGGSGGDPLMAGQDLNTWLGKILRIDVSGDGYAVPDDNPFVGQDGALPEIWAYGLRNPWRFTFDRATGDLYTADVGQRNWEEVNFQPASSPGGENYGWNVYEGLHPYSGAVAPADMVLPIAEYDHSEGVSVTGGYVYRGSQIPALQGAYLYGDFGTGRIWAAWRDSAMNWRSAVFMPSSGATISSFGEDEAGELYVVSYNGQIFRFDPA